ncbi:MAG: HlyD family type I secretion periplasmic adaptor subunit [Roseiarcus sp.]|jgi:membrane fusion protein, hemolysin D
MNQRTVPPKPIRPPPPLASAVLGRDREFLPAALEILETPPAPLPVALMLTICAFVAAALVWSFFGHLDVHAVAPGKIETAGHAKIIQPLDPGKIAAIHVENGEPVKAGDPLFELDPAEAAADEGAARDAMNAGLAEIARRRYAVQTAQLVQDAPEGPDLPDAASSARATLDAAVAHADRDIAWDPSIPEVFRLRERAVLTADLGQLADALNNLDKQTAQKQATRQRLRMSIAFQDTLIETLTQRVGTRQEAIDLKVGTKINLYDAKEELEKSQSQLASDQGQLIETDAAIGELESQKTKALSQFVADNENKRADAARKADEARQSLVKAAARLARTRLVSPIDGVAQQLAVTTVGQVVTTGQQLMMVTPSGGALRVEALVANLDIGFVKLGQTAVIKVDAFPFTRFGALNGKVIGIATEAIDEPAAKRAMANATAAASGASAPASAPGQPESFVFPVTIAIDQSSMRIGDADMPLTPGMTVSVEIKTDSRRVIDYLLSPLAKLASESLKER